jgi:CheY-like chemotaxis protein
MSTAVAPELDAEQRPASFDKSSPSPPEAESPLKALVVDDFLIERRLVGRLIQKVAGLRVIEAADGREALDVIEREAPAVVLTDLQMPRMSGLELVAAVRQKYPHLLVVLMTAYGSEEVAIQALRAGATNYVSKKALAAELPDTLKRVLSVAAMDKRRRRVMGCLEVREARFKLGNDLELIEPLIELLLEDLGVMAGCDSAARMQSGVALTEALTNAVYHGNLEVSSDLRQEDERRFFALAEERRGLPPYRDRRVEVHARIDPTAASFVIQDEGPGFDTAKLDRPLDPEDLLRIGGRGLLLIRAFMDEMQHNETGNRITLIKRSRACKVAQ